METFKVHRPENLVLFSHNYTGRLSSECLPKRLEEGKAYKFAITGEKEQSEKAELYERTKFKDIGPIALITIHLTDYAKRDGGIWTFGTYKINKLLKNDSVI